MTTITETKTDKQALEDFLNKKSKLFIENYGKFVQLKLI